MKPLAQLAFVLMAGAAFAPAQQLPDSAPGVQPSGWYFPPAGESLQQQGRRTPRQAGLDPAVIEQLQGSGTRWALWRHGYLVHVEGDLDRAVDVASLRKTWHAMTVGAFISQGRIPSYDRKISEYNHDLRCKHANATWRDVMRQASGFDYPDARFPHVGSPPPGEIWTYSDKNARQLCDALARVFGKKDHRDGYEEVIKAAYFDTIGMRGWKIGFSKQDDGIRFILDLEDMGRLGLLALARGEWAGRQVIPRWFVEELERKQSYGLHPVYNGPDDGNVGNGWYHEHRDEFPEPPYGYMTWANTSGDLLPGADRHWAYAAGAGGTRIMWNAGNGVVYAGAGVNERASKRNIAVVIEQNLLGPNPLVKPVNGRLAQIGQYERFEKVITNRGVYKDPYAGVSLDAVFTRPDGKQVRFQGFYDGGTTWRLRFMPDRLGVWQYRATFSDGSPGASGSFECVASDAPGVVAADPSNPLWFGYSSGRHFIMRAFHVGDRFFASNWAGEERKQFLDWAQKQGYNTLSIASHFLNRDSPGRGAGWATPKLWPLNAAEYRRMETILDDLQRRGFVVFPFAGFFGQKSNYPRDPADQERYIRYTLARLAAYPNLMWNTAGPEPNVGKGWMSSGEVERLARLIARLDPSGHLISVHNRTGDDPYRDADWTTYGVLQGPKTLDRGELSRGLLRNHHAAKPLMAQETLWSGNVNHIRKHGGYSEEDLRKNAWVIQMSAAALVFADNDGDSSTGFTGTMGLADRRQRHHDILRRVWDFMESVPFYQMKPRQDAVSAGYCLADPGWRYLVYLPEGGSVNVKAELGPFRVTWINARDTKERRAAGESQSGGDFRAPDAGDWLLYLAR